ncbi:DUF1857-domain-containing protein [Mytilinidion resinicola]|uniref:DUF1857-domain-containing protein n=1 Tax=Mytilinidion resinicola TaxID=574789 RepID=A0A6A6YL29_9PEZI|nr:DUF1857-domain-containing protein [Mytilinidion resinicola]KAF2809582.1 DUF1857-domain-containing protein [Mytilinidion resinicola]
MVNFYLAYTSPINPPSATPVLTVPQVWAGLQRKIRFAQEFVSAITSCEVLSEEDGVVTRVVQFKPGMGAAPSAKEVVTSFGNAWVEFKQEDGSIIRNLISDGPAGTVEDLHMTYMFEWLFPNLEEGSAEAEEQFKKSKAMAKMAVDGSINTIREMVKDGRIK